MCKKSYEWSSFYKKYLATCLTTELDKWSGYNLFIEKHHMSIFAGLNLIEWQLLNVHIVIILLIYANICELLLKLRALIKIVNSGSLFWDGSVHRDLLQPESRKKHLDFAKWCIQLQNFNIDKYKIYLTEYQTFQ